MASGHRYFAHTRAGQTQEAWERLEDHLLKTAARCEEFAISFAPPGWGRTLGLWHDLGKYQDAFQAYLRSSSDNNCTESPSVPHAPIGSLFAHQLGLFEIAMAVHAHHGALLEPNRLATRIGNYDRQLRTVLDGRVPARIATAPSLSRPSGLNQGQLALWVRFLFSALVDADSLVTEEWDRGEGRTTCPFPLIELLARLEHWLLGLRAESSESEMNRLRTHVQDACRRSATQPQGHFRLAVPTGGGKTIASLLFGLHHAAAHQLRRVIVVIPYTSIIDQTASIYRSILGDKAVLEHHSNLDPSKESTLNHIVSENWDSPVIVTTAVQFFESLFADHKRNCRKLHRIAKSVVVLDEVQTMPWHCMAPAREALNGLTGHFGVSVVHCSATQPDVIVSSARDIVDGQALLNQFPGVGRRVRPEWMIDREWSIEELSGNLLCEADRQVLVILETRRSAFELANRLGDEWIHLSAAMCAAHRRDTIEEIKSRLAKGAPCKVISTQLVEAGVDLDFPVVCRALAGFDALAQAAGRCNREGRLSEGKLRIFRMSTPPAGRSLQRRRQIASSMLKEGIPDLFDATLYPKFFSRLRQTEQEDVTPSVLSAEKTCNFPIVSQRFSMIEDEFSEPVVAPYQSWREKVEQLRAEVPTRERLRALQPLVVSIRPREISMMRAAGVLEPLFRHHTDEETKCWCVIPSRASGVYSNRFGFSPAGDADLIV